MVDQGLGGAANPAGAGGGGENAEFDETGSAPQKQKLDKINSEHPSFYSNQNSKKQSEDQCPIDEVLRMLKRFGDKNANMQEKPLKGFKKLTELKNSGPGPRIIIYREKNELLVFVCKMI